MKNVILPGDRDKVIFNCYEQQVMTLSYFYSKDYWKLFLGTNLEYQDSKYTYLEDIIKTDTRLHEMALRYYGIQWEELPSDENLTFDNHEIYFVSMNVKDYPFSREIEEDGKHCFLVYGRDKGGYLVNDNYYQVTDYILDEELYRKGDKMVYLIKQEKDFVSPSCLHNEVIEKMSHNYCDEFEKAIDLIESKNLKEYHSADLIDRIQACYSFIKKDVEILQANYSNDPYMEVCIEILDETANDIKKMWYTFIKIQLKYKKIPSEVLLEKLKAITGVLTVEKKAKQEIVNLLMHHNGLKEKLEHQLMEYLEVDEISDNRSVYEDHVSVAVMFMIIYWEEHNHVTELDYLSYKNLKTYGEYKLMTFRNIVRTGCNQKTRKNV